MFQPAILGLCVSFLADLLPVGSGARVDLATGARAELNAGRIPVTSVQDSAPGTEQTLVLRAGVRLISQTSSLSLIYRPRYYLRLADARQRRRATLVRPLTRVRSGHGQGQRERRAGLSREQQPVHDGRDRQASNHERNTQRQSQ